MKKKVNLKKYCKRGHDISITGRDSNRECTECRRARKKGILDSIVMPDEILQKIQNIPTKFCPHCNQVKDKTEFSPDKRRPDGLAGYCRSCNNKAKKISKSKKPEFYKTQALNYYKAHPEIVHGWGKRNPEKLKEVKMKWQKNHPEYRSHNEAKRRMRGKINFGQEGIVEFYKNCPSGYEVDHIIPLQGKYVSGLHVRWNLQYLLAVENRRKNNKFLVS